MLSSEVFKAIESLSTSEVAEALSNISQKSAVSMWEISRGLEQASEALSKMNITLFTPDGEFKAVKEVFKDIDSNSSILLNKKEEELLRPETIEKTEESNENSVFDFLNENAYDHIENFFISS
jgi:hypothetical protein